MSKSNLKPGYIRNRKNKHAIRILSKTHIDGQLDYDYPNPDKKKDKIINEIPKLVKTGIKFQNYELKKIRDIMLYSGKKYKATVELNNGTIEYLTMSEYGWELMDRLLHSGYHEYQVPNYGSDTFDKIVITGVRNIRFHEMPPPKKLFKRNGSLFKFINMSVINLERYQILSETTDINIINENCLIYCLRMYEIDEDKINSVKLSVNNGSYISKKDLHKISSLIGKIIRLYSFEKVGVNRCEKIQSYDYGDTGEVIEIALYEEHYFIFEDTIYTDFSVKNYSKTSELKNFHDIVKFKKGKPERSKNSNKINSLKLIDRLMSNNMFDSKHKRLSEMVGFNIKKYDFDVPLNNISEEQRECEVKEEITKKKNSIFFGDTESIVTSGDHILLLTGIVGMNSNNVKIHEYNEESPSDHVDNMFFHAVNKSNKDDNIIIYFHNLKYDFSVLKPYIYVTDQCEKDGSIYNVKIMFNGRIIELRDSKKLINSPLGDFGKIFSLPEDMRKKEAIGYNFYTERNVKLSKHKIKDYVKFLKPGEKKILMEALKNNSKEFEYDEKKKTFNAMKYYKYYLKYDCLVLKEGLKVFDEKISLLLGISAFNSLTISSLSNKYFKNKGCFEGLCEITGNLRQYISMAITGGRCTVLEDYIKKEIPGLISDLDACSLYPSAIERLCLEKGLPLGKCKRINKYDKKTLDGYNYYVVTICIKKINKKQQIPFISKKDEEGILRYINEVPVYDQGKGGYKCVVDSITLEDYIKFHKIDYEILDGVYWDNGVNKKYGEVIKYLYNERLKEKKKAKTAPTEDERKSGDVMQEIIKLILNSSYGKTIIKKTHTGKIILPKGDKLDQYLYNNYHTIKKAVAISDKQFLVQYDAIDTTYNLAHAGVMVLSYSKRIMNEVMGIANDADIKIYYQDTDSMHLDLKNIKKLEKLYEEEYGRKLLGKTMGCFQTDFKLSGADSEIYSTNSIFLGKKCYIDVLECINKDGSKVSGYHIRLKGVTQSGIKHCIDNKFEGEPLKMFRHLAKGETLEFVLNPKHSVSMEYTDRGVYNRDEGTFTRELSF